MREEGYYWVILEHSHNKGAWDIAEYVDGDFYIGDERWRIDRIKEIDERRIERPDTVAVSATGVKRVLIETTKPK